MRSHYATTTLLNFREKTMSGKISKAMENIFSHNIFVLPTRAIALYHNLHTSLFSKIKLGPE